MAEVGDDLVFVVFGGSCDHVFCRLAQVQKGLPVTSVEYHSALPSLQTSIPGAMNIVQAVSAAHQPQSSNTYTPSIGEYAGRRIHSTSLQHGVHTFIGFMTGARWALGPRSLITVAYSFQLKVSLQKHGIFNTHTHSQL